MSRKFRWFLVLFAFFVSGGILAQNYTIDGDAFWTVNVQNACYSGDGVVGCSSPDERGCVINPIWTTWSFEHPGDIQLRKIVRPTQIPWIFDVNIWIRWKRVVAPRICSIVLFDISGSMWIVCIEGSDDPTKWTQPCIDYAEAHPDHPREWYIENEKWYSAVSGAVEYSNILHESNPNAKIWLVVFWQDASIKRELDKNVLDNDLFEIETRTWTNLHDWLIKAQNMFNSETEWCEDGKYLVVMSDGYPTRFIKDNWTVWTSHPEQNCTGTNATAFSVDKAQEMKDSWIRIYTIWYLTWLKSENFAGEDCNEIGLAEYALSGIVSPGLNYNALNEDAIGEVFEDIWNQIGEWMNPWTNLKVIDKLWEFMITWTELNIPDNAEITEIGDVYSFQIKVDPSKEWSLDSNDWLTIEYDDLTWNTQTLEITGTAKIYWTGLECSWILPSWEFVMTGRNKFVQFWSGDELLPENKEWTYVDSWTLWECEWKCEAGYTWNIVTNTCEYISIPVTVTFNPNGWTSAPSPVTTESWELINKPTDPIKTWYHLSWWTRTCNENDFFNFWSDVVTANITLCAKWEPNTYQVKFNKNGWTGTMWNQILTYDVQQNLDPNLYVKEWSSFVKWTINPDGSGTGYEDGASVKNLATTWVVDLYAQWSENSYTIVFSWNGWKWTMANQTLSYGHTWTLNANSFTKTWYHFSWWNTNPGGGGTWYEDQANVRNLATWWVVTLYAWWEPNIYTIVFSWNGSTSGTMMDVPLTYDVIWTLWVRNNFEKEWYTFSWWNTKADWSGTGYVYGDQIKNLAITWKVTLYAQWKPNTYQVRFNWNWWGGTMPNQTLTYDSSDNLSHNLFDKWWYTFVGWNTKIDGTETGYADDELVENLATTWIVDLYAQWSQNIYEIRFDNNGWTGTMTNQTLSYDTTWTLKSNEFERMWYYFSWWNVNADWSGTGYVDRDQVRNLATTWVVTLYAQWDLNAYVIIFDWNGANNWSMPWLNVKYNQEVKLTPNAYSRSSYKFLWWNTSPDWKWTNYTDQQVVKNLVMTWEVRLYAQWQRLWSSWGGWWGCIKDDCPDWDYSWDRCDGKCWKKPDPELITDPEPIVKNCSIEGSTHSQEVNEAYVWACQKWIIESNTIQGAKLWEFLNRAEMAKIVTIFELFELEAIPNMNKDCSAFADSMSWYSKQMKNYMITSCQLERMWINTADYTPIPDFMPRKYVSRAEFWTILSRILWWEAYEALNNSRYYYVEHLNRLKARWIMSNIDPTLVERRSYAILMIYRAAKMLGKV